jgi:glycosyltransferase involved in cell wall biosynthesis
VISFIIPAYNEEQLLPATLAALQEAACTVGEPYEIIVVDDASTDRTAAIAEERGVRAVRVSHRQIAATRNSGARAADGDLLIFVDADTLVNAPVMRATLQAVRDGAIGGGCELQFEGPLPLWAKLMIGTLRPVYRIAKIASGSYLFCTRQAFGAVGGFDEKLFAAEEGVMSKALRRHGRFVIVSESVLTSGRKLRSYSAREVFGVLGRMVLTGGRALRDRRGLEIWYGARRPDPQAE